MVRILDNPIFNESALPDYAYLTAEETAQAFGWCVKTLRNHQTKGEFPQPTAYPWGKAYNVGALREFLRSYARREVENAKGAEIVREGAKAIKRTRRRQSRAKLLEAL